MLLSYIVSKKLSRIARAISAYSDKTDKLKVLKDRYALDVEKDSDPEYVKVLYESIQRLPSKLVKDCEITKLRFEDLGPSREYYPNHGKYSEDGTLALNYHIIDDPLLIIDPQSGEHLTKFDQTFYHELGHGWDHVNGDKRDLSMMDDWTNLSGWSEQPKPKFHRITIREPGVKDLVGEYYFDPKAGFTRFYAKRNPWDDFADSFAYYVAGLKSFLPPNKVKYFDEKLGRYFKGEQKDV